MTPKKQTKAQRIQQLERQNLELTAQLTGMLHFASVGLKAARGAKGGAVVVQMHWLGGKEVCPPFALKDGPSDALIEALVEDLRRTFNEQTELKP